MQFLSKLMPSYHISHRENTFLKMENDTVAY